MTEVAEFEDQISKTAQGWSDSQRWNLLAVILTSVRAELN